MDGTVQVCPGWDLLWTESRWPNLDNVVTRQLHNADRPGLKGGRPVGPAVHGWAAPRSAWRISRFLPIDSTE